MDMFVECKECGKRFKAPAEMMGKRAKCKCGAVIEVPALAREAAQPEPQARPQAARAAAKRGRPKAALTGKPPAPARSAGGGSISERYQKRATQGPSVIAYIGIGGAAVGVIIILLAAIFGGGDKQDSPEKASSDSSTEKSAPAAGAADQEEDGEPEADTTKLPDDPAEKPDEPEEEGKADQDANDESPPPIKRPFKDDFDF